MKNPFRGLRFSMLDFKNMRSSTGMKVAMAIIAIIPLIYGALYLCAFYDPYNKLNEIPVAIVNDDVAATTASGKSVNAGQDVVDQLKDNTDGLKWYFTNDSEAQSGLESGKYYMKLVIPSDFSSNIASADSSNPKQASFQMVGNQSDNFLATTLGASVFRVVTSRVNNTIGDNYYVQIFDKIGDSGQDIKTAADGASTLTSGLSDAQAGSQTITDNLGTATDGSQTLTDGLVDAADGSNTISTNMATAADGAQTLADGTVTAANGSALLTSKLAEATTGANTLYSGISKASSGSSEITAGLESASTGADALSAGVATAADGASQLSEGISQAKTGTAKLSAGASALKAAIDAKQSDLATLDAGATSLTAGLKKLDDSVNVATLTANLAALKGSADKLAKGSEAAKSAADGLSTGTLESDASKLGSDADSITSAAGSLSSVSSDADAVVGDVSTAGSKWSAAAGSVESVSDGLSDAENALAKLKAGDTLTQEEIDAIQGGISTAEGGLDTVKSDAQDASAAADAASSNATTIKNTVNGVSIPSSSTVSADAKAVKTDLGTITTSASGILSNTQTIVAGVSTLTDKTSLLVGSLASLPTSVDALYQGAQKVQGGVSQTVASLTTIDSATNPTTLKGVAYALASGTSDLDGGSDQTKGMNALVNGSAALSAGLNGTAATSATAAKTGAKQGAAALASALKDELVPGSSSLSTGLTTASTGSQTLASGLGQLTDGSQTLTTGLTSAKTGAATLASGLEQLSTGSNTLTKGLVTARDGSSTLTSGLTQLTDGSATLTSGIGTAKDGSNTLASGLSDGYDTVLTQTANSDAKASMMSQPVTLNEDDYTTVSNYGTGFAPYFISLGLWVGALMTSFLMKPLNKRLICSGASPIVAAFSGLAPALVVALVQAVLLGLTLQFLLRIDIAFVPQYYAIIILAAVCFAAITQMLMALFGFPGKFVSILLLMLQLTSAAGTFPIETAPKFFQVISPYLPMTYIVRALRVATTGLDISLIGPSIAVIGAFAAVSFLVTCLVARRKRLITMLDLHPLVEL
ncbi:MAG: YhgE/Pip domain-containing protein [Atopobiaceae bacterium]|jgi:putative membrane protein|nr:YhgE/Pip domain-containing protein [Atopobiaceae bacterium]